MDDLYAFVRTGMKALPRAEWPVIATESGVPPGTVYHYAHGHPKNPKYLTLVKIANALKARAQ